MTTAKPPPPPPRTRFQPAAARRHLVAWLVEVFRPPTAASLEAVAATPIADLGAAAGLGDLGERAPAAADAGAPELRALQSEYVRLFVNSHSTRVASLDAAPHIASEDPRVVAGFLAALDDELRTAGLSLAPTAPEPPDHLTVMLERILWLPDAAFGDLGHHPFVTRFLTPWLPNWLRTLAAAQPHPYYRRGARVLAGLLGLHVPWGGDDAAERLEDAAHDPAAEDA